MTTFLGVLPILDGVPTTFTNQGGGLRGIIIGNESGLTTIIAMDGTSNSKSLYPGTVDFFPIDGAFSGTIKVNPTARLSNTSQWPSSFLQFDAVGINEQVNTGVYPLTLPRLTNIGNSVPVSTSTNGITNEGNPINTEVVDVGPLGNIKAIDIFNDHFIWSVIQAGVAHQVLKGNIAGNPLQIGQAGDTSEVLGNFKVAGNVDLNTGTGTQTIIHNALLHILSGVTASFVNDAASTLTGDVTLGGNLIPNQGSVVHLVGGVAGTVDLYAIMTGVIKVYLLVLNNFKTGVSAQSIVLPTPFTVGSFFVVTDTGAYNLVASAANQTISFMTTTQNSTSTTTGQSWNIASLIHAWDTITWGSGNSNFHNGFFFFVGV